MTDSTSDSSSRTCSSRTCSRAILGASLEIRKEALS